jgi:hypothetical protein
MDKLIEFLSSTIPEHVPDINDIFKKTDMRLISRFKNLKEPLCSFEEMHLKKFKEMVEKND